MERTHVSVTAIALALVVSFLVGLVFGISPAITIAFDVATFLG